MTCGADIPNPDMFGGYTEVAAYYVNTPWPESGDGSMEAGEDQLPPDYMPQHAPCDPWHKHTVCHNDFIMIAEFSEQEGPKPLIIIPKDGGGSFDLNEFSVRIMSVDFQTVSGVSFSMSEDTQVIMSETSNGLYAYVHHFTLYDYQARGFVRPFCMSYVTPDQNKLFSQFEDLSAQFRKVARCFKSGNLDLFVKDLTHYLSDLHFTKERFLEREQSLHSLTEDDLYHRSCVLGDAQEEALLKTVTISGLDSLIKEVKGILEATSIMLTELEDITPTSEAEHGPAGPVDPGGSGGSAIQDPVDLDNFRYSCSLHSQSPAKMHYSHEQRERAASASQVVSNWTDDKDVYKPKLVRTTKKRFERALRTLHELCMWGAKAGINRLRSLHKYFSRDLYTLQIEQSDAESLEPTVGLLTIGRTVILNFLDGLQIARSLTEGDCDSIDTTDRLERKWFSSDTVGSFHSADSFLSCVEDISPTSHQTPQIIMGDTSIHENISKTPTKSVIKNHEISPNHSLNQTASVDENCSYNSIISASDSFDTAHDSVSSIQGNSSHQGADLSDVNSEPMKVGVLSSIDHVTNFNQSSVGYGIQKLMSQYAGACHVIYSLLMGRTTVVFATFRMEKEIRATVNSLAMFVPGHSNLSCIEPYHSSTLSIKDLTRYKLVGLCRPERRKLEHMVPSSVMRYVTIFDIEKKAIWASRYDGGVLTDLCNKRKVFSHEQTYVTHIHSLLYGLAVKSFIYFHKFCLGCKEAKCWDIDSSAENHWVSPQERIAHNKISFNILENLHVNSQDSQIVQYFSEVIKLQHTELRRQGISDVNTAKLQYSDCSWIKT